MQTRDYVACTYDVRKPIEKRNYLVHVKYELKPGGPTGNYAHPTRYIIGEYETYAECEAAWCRYTSKKETYDFMYGHKGDNYAKLYETPLIK